MPTEYKTQVLPADAAGIALAAQYLRQGVPFALPTETVYGIAADAANAGAVRGIFVAKGRPQDNPLIVHIADMGQLSGLVAAVPERAQKLAAAFWPGPLTMVLPRGAGVCDAATAGLDTVGVRMPSHPVVQAVIRAAGGIAFAAPSANLSGRPSPTTAADTLADMDGRLPLILDGGPCTVGVESTVVSLAGERPLLLRPGAVTKEQMERVLGEEVPLSGAILDKLKPGQTARSPGMKYKHYAPKAELTLVKGDLAAFKACLAAQAEQDAGGLWALCFTGEGQGLPVPALEYGAENDPAEQARRLFSALRELDARGARAALVRCPAARGVGLAVYNRLLRAAAFRVVEL